MMAEYRKDQFSLRELTMNTNGKQSGSGFIGVILGLIAAASFVAAMVGYFFQIPNTLEVMGEILKIVAAASILMGIRKVSADYTERKNGNGVVPPVVPPVVDSKKG